MRRAASRAIWMAGSRSPTIIPMIAMTTSNSTSVNPKRCWRELMEGIDLAPSRRGTTLFRTNRHHLTSRFWTKSFGPRFVWMNFRRSSSLLRNWNGHHARTCRRSQALESLRWFTPCKRSTTCAQEDAPQPLALPRNHYLPLTSSIRSSAIKDQRAMSASTSMRFTTQSSRRFSSVQQR